MKYFEPVFFDLHIHEYIVRYTLSDFFFRNTLYFTFHGVMTMLLHDFHENTFYPK